MQAHEKRKQYLINKDFQIKFILKVYLIVFTAIVAVGVLLFILNDKELSQSAYQQILSMKSARDMLLPTILSISAVTAVVTLVIVIFRFILETHRIVGPIYRFNKAFESIEQGDLTTLISLREKDEMQDLAVKFNKMVNSLNSKIVSTKSVFSKLQQTNLPADTSAENFTKTNEELQKIISELGEELSKIKT